VSELTALHGACWLDTGQGRIA